VERRLPDPVDRICALSQALLDTDSPKSKALAWLVMARAHDEMQNLEEALSCYTHYAHLCPKDPNGWRGLAAAAEHAQKWQEAQIAWNHVRALTRGQEATAARHRDMGEQYRALGEFTESKRWYKKAMETNPTLWAAWWGYGISCQEAGDLEEAGVLWEKMLKCPLPDPLRHRVKSQVEELNLLSQLGENESPESLARYAAYQAEREEYEEAIRLLDQALAMETGSKKRSEYLQSKAIFQERMRNWQEASTTWEEVAECERIPRIAQEASIRSSKALARWVESLLERGQIHRSLDALERLKDKPDFPDETWRKLRQNLLGRILFFHDSFLMGNVDIDWKRERGSWIIHRGRLEGADGRLWLRKKLPGPAIVSARIEIDPQYPGQPGLFLCAQQETVGTTGYHLLLGTARQDTVLYRAGKPVATFPGLIAAPGEPFDLQMEAYRGTIKVYENEQHIASFEDHHPLCDKIRAGTVAGLAARGGIVYFDQVTIYDLN